VWGSSNSVNVQVNLYLLSRIIVAAGKRFGWTFEDSRKYPVFASIVWGVVMLLFEESPESLHSSLRNSMEEIYRFELPE
jgi:peroxisomal membrane protein 4